MNDARGHTDANAGAPSVLVAYGEDDARILHQCSLAGMYLPLVLADGSRRLPREVA